MLLATLPEIKLALSSKSRDLLSHVISECMQMRGRIPSNVMATGLFASALFPILNSLFNPLIYAFRITYFRVAFIQLVARKTISRAGQVEKKIFGPRPIGVDGTVDAGQEIRH